MAQNETPITIVGNLVADPELRYTPNGAAVCNFRVASTPRRYNSQTQQWEDGDALYLTCNAWKQQAENIANSLTKGMRIIVNGVLKQRNYESREGERRSVFEVEVSDCGPALLFATAQVARTQPGGNQQQARPQQNNNAGFNQQQPNPWGGQSTQYNNPPF